MQHVIRAITDRDYLDAIQKGDIVTVQKYLAISRNSYDMLNARTYKENLPALSWAIVNKRTDIALLIIEAGADLNTETNKGVTPLFLAASLGNVDIVRALLGKPDIKINTVHFSGYNALESAAMRGHTEVVRMLLAAGAIVQRSTLLNELNRADRTEIAALINQLLEEKASLFPIKSSEIQPKDKILIGKLTARNIARLQKVAANLSRQGNLNSESFSYALSKVGGKNPSVQPSKLTKSTETPGMYRVNDMSFFLSSKPLSAGGQAIVHAGYVSPEAVTPTIPAYCVKTFSGNKVEFNLKTVTSETKYLQLMGRRAAIIQAEDSLSLVTEWQPGEDILELSKIKFESLTFAQRLKWLASGLADLNKLHHHFRMHGDIKVTNFIIDTTTDSMKLIDMGGAQKINSPKLKVSSLGFMDPNEGKPKKMASDMYAMGKVMAFLFPELYKCEKIRTAFVYTEPHEERKTANIEIAQFIQLKIANLTPIESAVIQLVNAMMDAAAENRCTSEQALQFCSGLLEKMVGNEIDPASLAELLDATINRKDFTVEDALRDSSRPALFAAQAEERKAGDKAVEPPAAIVDSTPAKKHKAKKTKPEEEERKPRTKHATSPAVMFNPIPKKKQKEEDTRPVRAARKKKTR